MVFFCVAGLIITEKLNRAIAALLGAIICYFALLMDKSSQVSITTFIEFLFGSTSDNYDNFHAMILILGISIIVQICTTAGMFQFISFSLVLLIIDKPKLLLFILCTITVILSSILNNITTILIMIPLTVTVSRILNIDPEPYIICQGILVNVGGIIFSISSIPNILITSAADITFIDYFLNIGIIGLVIYGFSVGFFYFYFRQSVLRIPTENIKILKEFNPYNFIPNRPLLYKSVIVLFTVILLFIIIPPTTLQPGIIALIGAVLLIIISRLEIVKILEKVDTELFLYLMGIFVIVGAIQNTGILETAGVAIANFAGDNIITQVLIVIWAGAVLSSSIDSIPITKILIPIVAAMADGNKIYFYSLAIGANLGDNLTPVGDNQLVFSIAAKNKRPMRVKTFWKVAFTTTVFQLLIISAFFSFRLNSVVIGFILLLIFIFGLFGYIYFKQIIRFLSKNRTKNSISQNDIFSRTLKERWNKLRDLMKKKR